MDPLLAPELRAIKNMGIKPNYSELSRKFKMDRHTIKAAYMRLDEPPKPRKQRPSVLDGLRDEIAGLLSDDAVKVKAAYWYLCNEGKVRCTYSNFKQYVRKNGLRPTGGDATPHPLYETDPGSQVQCDWVESMSISFADGTEFAFNLFSATLGFSRLHYFELAERRNEATFKRCFCHLLRWMGGRTREMLTDNMSALVSILKTGRKVHPSVAQFSKDVGVAFRFAEVRSPQTKGKDESSNRFAKRLAAYDGKIRSKEHLAKVIADLVRAINAEANQSTGVPPRILFLKEKERLLPLPSNAVLEGYEGWSESRKVPPTQLVYHRGSRYSVPPNYISKTVFLEEDSGQLLIYHAGLLVACHGLCGERNSVSYDEGHLREGLSRRTGLPAESAAIDEYCRRTMSAFKAMGAN